MTAAPVRILHVTQAVDAGVGSVVAGLIADQAARGWDVAVACPDGRLVEQAGEAGVPVHHWPAVRSPIRGRREWPALRSVIAEYRPDVVHLHSSKAGLVGRQVIRGGIPTIFQPHAWSFDAVTGPTAAAAAAWERFAARWTTRLLCVSDDELRIARDNHVLADSVVIPNGVDTGRWRPVDQAGARARLGLRAGPLAVCVGRVTEQKGQDLMVRAWDLMGRPPRARLALVGDGPRFPEWSAATAGRDDVLWPGGGDPADWYAAADVVVVPSRWEGMALVPLEAMASGRPVVGFAVAGLAESVGDAGEVVAAGDLAALAAAVATRLADPALASKEGGIARDRAVAAFDLRRSLDRTAEVVHELIASRHSDRDAG